jgi:hypothetical protein
VRYAVAPGAQFVQTVAPVTVLTDHERRAAPDAGSAVRIEARWHALTGELAAALVGVGELIEMKGNDEIVAWFAAFAITRGLGNLCDEMPPEIRIPFEQTIEHARAMLPHVDGEPTIEIANPTTEEPPEAP